MSGHQSSFVKKGSHFLLLAIHVPTDNFLPAHECVRGLRRSFRYRRKLDPKFLEQGLRLEIGAPERDGLAVQQRPMVNDLDDRVGPGNADVEYRRNVAILDNNVVVAESCEIEHVGNTWQ